MDDQVDLSVSTTPPRRSQRKARSAYASDPQLKQPPPKVKRDEAASASGAREPKKARTTASSNAKRARRSRPSNPPKSTSTSSIGPAKAKVVNSQVPLTPMGISGTSLRIQSRRVLGKYTPAECQLLLETILDHLKAQANCTDALEKEVAPSHVEWDDISVRMAQTHRLTISAVDCQRLWKFIAYGQTPVTDTDDLQPSSDEEELELSAEEVNDRRERGSVKNEKEAVSRPLPPDTTKAQAGVDDGDKELQLYPVYELPPGQPAGWHRPFDTKSILAWPYVASKFLKPKDGASADLAEQLQAELRYSPSAVSAPPGATKDALYFFKQYCQSQPSLAGKLPVGGDPPSRALLQSMLDNAPEEVQRLCRQRALQELQPPRPAV